MGVTVTFVAILELLREGLIEIVQSEPFAPIHVRAGAALRLPHVGYGAGRYRPAGQRTMTENPLASVVEAVLLAAGRPVSVDQLLELFDEPQRLARRRAALGAAAVAAELRRPRRRAQGSGERLARAGAAATRGRGVAPLAGRPSRYSRALLETLALIAYRQPITRGEIEGIRGVTVSTTIMRTLHERNWIRVVGTARCRAGPNCSAPREFLDYFGLKPRRHADSRSCRTSTTSRNSSTCPKRPLAPRPPRPTTNRQSSRT